jgi:hypothetical protein
MNGVWLLPDAVECAVPSASRIWSAKDTGRYSMWDAARNWKKKMFLEMSKCTLAVRHHCEAAESSRLEQKQKGKL